MKPFDEIYYDRRILVTGHTGFKGSWLALWLQMLEADVVGISLDPQTSPNHWDLLDLDMADRRQDIRDADAVARIVKETRPEIVFHLAAQPLVRHSYEDPLTTWSTNVVGTANLLEACRETSSVRAIVIVTSDKCYENLEWVWGYRENDRLGGHDPYSASKAATELVAASYRKSFFHLPSGPLLATARAGNVIGGGDWSQDRLIPDLVRAWSGGKTMEIRSPNASRPWQHVLDSLYGYLLLGQRLLEGRAEFADAWNFGPDQTDSYTVQSVLEHIKPHWPRFDWRVVETSQPHEASSLQLDSTKARQRLCWNPMWGFKEALNYTAKWYLRYSEEGVVTSSEQLNSYTRTLEQC